MIIVTTIILSIDFLMKSNWKLSLLLAGQQGNTQRIKSIQSIRDHAPRVRVGNRKLSVPRLVYLMKTKAQLAASRSKKCTTPMSPTPIDHITWDGMSEVSAVLVSSCFEFSHHYCCVRLCVCK